MADDLVLNVRQLAQYPLAASINGANADVLLFQQGGVGGPYMSLDPRTLFSTALVNGGWLQLALGPAGGIAFNGAGLSFQNGSFQFTEDVHVPSLHSDGDIFVNGIALANQIEVTGLFDVILENSVWTFNGRKGNVQLEVEDVLRAGAAPITSPHFNGWVTAPTSWNVLANDDTVATVAWVQQWACQSGLVVRSYNGRGGAVIPMVDDVTVALTSQAGVYALANTPPMGDASAKLATTMFVDNAVEDLRSWTNNLFETKEEAALLQYAPINSPNLTGVPTAPTANPGTTTGQIATTAFVQHAVTASTTGVASFNTRTGAVTLTAADITGAGGAVLASPAFTGAPTAPTAAPGDNTTKIATTAFVETAIAAVAAGVTSFNTRTGAVTLALADITGVGGAPLASPALSGTPTAPTPGAHDNSTKLATTAYVDAAVTASAAGVASFNSRTGAVTLIGADVSAAGGALVASPIFTGTPTAPTPLAGDSSTKLATTAFVAAAVAATGGVSTFNGRSGAVTLTAADVTGVGGALLAGPTFTGVPAAPTATAGTNSTQLATTAFVQTALAAAPGGVSSFNTRTGAITLNSGDISAASGALIASPNFSGTPKAPTPTVGDNSTNIATTAFVATALAGAGGVSSFNSRAGAVTLSTADVQGAAGAIYRQAAAAPATANETFWFDQIGGQLYVQYVDPSTSAKTWVIANAPLASGILYSSTTFPATGAPGNATTTSATYTTAANSSVNTIYKVRMCGGGAGGNAANSGATFPGSGGGGGEFKEFLLSGVAASTAIALAIGNPGAAGVAGTSVPMAGGNTTLSFGTTSIVCSGGGPPPANVSGSTWQYGGSGGKAGATTAGAATVTLQRQCNGGDGTSPNGIAGNPNFGGASVLGVPSFARIATATSGTTDGGGYGPGGAGAWTTATNGWNGMPGVVIIERIAG